MTRIDTIIGYVYEADIHCIDCARRYGLVIPAGLVDDTLDENGISYLQEDSLGNGLVLIS